MSKTSLFLRELKCLRSPVCRRIAPPLLKVIGCFLKALLVVQEAVFVNIVFRVQYVLTVIILLSLSLVITARQCLWSPVNCRTGDQDHISSLCYTFPPFSSVGAFNASLENVPYPGIPKPPYGDVVYHNYYHWVSSVLFLQAVLFVLPWYFWRTVGVRRVQDVLKDTEKFHSFSDEIASSTQNWSYLVFFFVKDVLNVLNVIGQIFLMDSFLGGNFLTYGSDFICQPKATPKNPYDVTVRVFPRMAICEYRQFNREGSVQQYNIWCSLPLNVIYQKVYLFLWFYFIVLATMSCFALVYHSVLLLVRPMRERILVLLTRLDAKSAQCVTRSLDVGAWFYLYNLSKNLDIPSQRQLRECLRENFANEKSISIEMGPL